MNAIMQTGLKRIFRYVLKKYFGQYLEDFSQDELTYGLKHGKGSVENVRLNIESLNELSEEYNLPVEFLHGSIDFVSVTVPWTAIMSENTTIELKGIKLRVQPKERPENSSMFNSAWSMTSSLQLAQECFKTNAEDEEDFEVPDKSDGLEKTAKLIDGILANMKVLFYDTDIRIEQVLGDGASGIALEIKIARAEYFDESGVNSASSSSDSKSVGPKKSAYEPQAYSFKKVVFEGVSLHTSEFSPNTGAFFIAKQMSSEYSPSQFVPGSPEMPPPHSSLPMKRTERELQDEPILISRLTGQQELRLKLKQNDAIIGPKVDVEFNVGAFNLFLTPQQVHMLLELVYGLMKPNSNDSSKKLPLSLTNKPMRPADYALVEQELMRQQERCNVPSRSLKNHQGWSSHSLDESDEEFHLMTMENRSATEFPASNDNESLCSSINSDTRSDSTSNVSVGNQRFSKSRSSSVQAMLQDPLSELTHFRACCSSFCIIILHDDSVQESLNSGSSNTAKLNCRSSRSLKERSEIFFDDLVALQLSGIDFKDFSATMEPLSKLCDTNHLRLMASSISLEGNEKSSSAQRNLNFTLSMFQFEVLECLFNSANVVNNLQTPIYVQVISCENKLSSIVENYGGAEACFKMKYQQVECTSQNQTFKPPANKLDIHFGLMTCEVDISLTDRIRTLLNFQNAFGQAESRNDDWKESDVGSITRVSSKTEINISSPNLVINLRFPIPDLRSVHDMERVPWWQQNLHKEVLVMDLKEVTFATALDGDVSQTKFEIQCQDFHGLLQLSETLKPVSFLRVSVDPDVDEISRERGFDWPRLVINKITKISSGDLDPGLVENEETFTYSLSDVLMSNMDNEPSPFCSTSVAYGLKLQGGDSFAKEEKSSLSDHDEVIKPADKENILNFIEQTINKSEYVLEFTLPTVNVILPNKDFFEVLYNRLGSDLILWENASLAPTAPYDPSGFKVHVPGLDFDTDMMKGPIYDQFPIFKPFCNDSNSDSDEEEGEYYSVYEYCQRQKQKHKKKSDNYDFTKLSISLAITKGMLSINTPALDNSAEVIPGHCGKMQLRVQEGLLFIASSYKGDRNESYLCLLAEKSTLYHNGFVVQERDAPLVHSLSSHTQSNLNCIIYESEQGAHLMPATGGNNNKDMLKVAVHIVNNPKQQIKTFKVAINISEATLRHYMLPVQQLWINQFTDFLKIKDYPVNGYIPSAVVTELHVNLSNCAVDYRPLKLPYRAAITVENFNMSCNVTATTPSFLFRIISEEMRFFISNNVAVKKLDLEKNYVCVIDTGLIDFSFRTNVDEKNDPKLEMCATNNKVHVRTCADSLKAILDLIVYLSGQGDMEINLNEIKKENTEELKLVTPKVNSDANDIHILMAEAMKECSANKFAGKNSDSLEGDFKNMDDEFCILEDAPGVGFMPRNGEPQIRILTDEPIQIVENYFAVPPGRSDVLKAPKHYPKPFVLVILREMSLIWHIYGGSDFKRSSGKGKRSLKSNGCHRTTNGVSFSDEKKLEINPSHTSVSFCNVTPLKNIIDVNNLQFSMENITIDHNKIPITESWLHKGGPNRNHNVVMELQMSKVLFQREIYPVNNKYASRYILLINDIEIRDRLASSQINKFLYQYSNKTMPRQSHANMVDIKALYTRPDPKHLSEECSLKVSCKPLRLNVDQDALLFLIDFFQEVLEVPSECAPDAESENCVTTVCVKPSSVAPVPARKISLENGNGTLTPETFYRFFSFSPEVLIRIDYHGKRVIMEQGAVRGLLMGLGQLNSSQIKLKPIYYRHGLLGHHRLLAYATSEWQQDIIKNQLPSVLGGVGPMHSFVQLFQGIKDLFYEPVAQYRKDGQIVRGLQRGASSFSTSTAMAFLDLTSRLVGAIQAAAEVAYDMVSPGPSVTYEFQSCVEPYRRSSQPADIREGVATAYNVVKEGFSDTARTIYRVASNEHEHKGVPGAVGGVLRQIPPSLFKPIIVGSKATHCVLGGVRHQLMPDAHQEDIHKWRTKNS